MPPRRERTISIHPPRAGRDAQGPGLVSGILISIHPPRAGRDAMTLFSFAGERISIHPPRAGRDIISLPAWITSLSFNPPAPCGAGPAGSGCSCSIIGISIHPPRAGRDVAGAERPTLVFLFQSTRPVRGGTGTERSYRHKQPVISIHPPRAGRDPPFLWHLSPQR